MIITLFREKMWEKLFFNHFDIILFYMRKLLLLTWQIKIYHFYTRPIIYSRVNYIIRSFYIMVIFEGMHLKIETNEICNLKIIIPPLFKFVQIHFL